MPKTSKGNKPKVSISQYAKGVKFLRKSRKAWRMFDETKPWIPIMYSSFFDIKPGQRIVDVGCGAGDFTRILAGLGNNRVKILGIDANEKGIAAAIADTKKAGLSKIISYKVGDAYKLPVEDDYADLTCCRTLLLHLDKPVDAVKEMVRITKPGGTVAAVEDTRMGIFHDPADPEYTQLGRRQFEAWMKGIQKIEDKEFSIGEKIPGIFKEAGLTDIRAETQVDTLVNSDPRRTLRDVRQTLEFGYSSFKERREADRKYTLAGGMPRKQVDRYDRRSLEKMEELLSDNQKLRADASFSAAALIMVAGTKRV